MKTLKFALLFFITLPLIAIGQKLDSIGYQFGNLYYHEYGTGVPVIILSGGPGGSYIQEEEMAIEVGKRYRSILLEQRGTGRSIPIPFDSTTINLNAALDDINLLYQHLKINKAILLGHSWGAMLAMSFAASYPQKVQALILVCPGPYKDWNKNSQILLANLTSRSGIHEQYLLDSINMRMTKGIANGADSLARRKLLLPAQSASKLFYDSVVQKKIALPSSPKMNALMIRDLNKHYDLSETLKNYKGPMDVIGGRQDYIIYNNYEIKLLMPSTELHWIDNCGHWPAFEQPNAFYSMLFEVLMKVN
jgi:proline iminopeptidase